MNKPTNSDVYTVPMARFVETFARVLGDPALPHLFFVDGGALAVENALKVAFDWKSRHNEARGIDPALGTRVLHLRGAFHGRSGYTLSLTNTDPNKVARFPKFDWPRIDAPHIRPGADMDAIEAESLRQARAAFEAHPHDVACFIAEPIQGEGGDRHFRPQFFAAMRELCDEFDALLIADEVQTGCGITGTPWAYQQLGFTPDVVAFGKKTQVCGIMAGRRVDEVTDNVFTVSSRINSTWGGNLVDMVRSRRILEVVEADQLFAHAARLGAHLRSALDELAAELPGRGARRAGPRTDVRLQPADHRAARRPADRALGARSDHARQRPGQRPVPARADRDERRARPCGGRGTRGIARRRLAFGACGCAVALVGLAAVLLAGCAQTVAGSAVSNPAQAITPLRSDDADQVLDRRVAAARHRGGETADRRRPGASDTRYVCGARVFGPRRRRDAGVPRRHVVGLSRAAVHRR